MRKALSLGTPDGESPQSGVNVPPPSEPPAHRLLLELEQVPGVAEQDMFSELPSQTSSAAKDIASAKIEMPPYMSPQGHVMSWWPDAIWYASLGLFAITLLFVAYQFAIEAPVPEVRVGAALVAKRARVQRAMFALEQGHRFAKAGNEERAISAYREALKEQPALPAAERGLAIMLTRTGQKVGATQHYERYLKLAPDAKDAKRVKRILARWRSEWAR
ncbi:MAG: tetratricopeptide repeat protein [Myxococcales bacterium]|nr:tetratricopeptide repeat protein [Myxococcales bacterium]